VLIRKVRIFFHATFHTQTDRGVAYFTLYSMIVSIIFHYNITNALIELLWLSWIHLLSTIKNQFINGDMRNYFSEKE